MKGEQESKYHVETVTAQVRDVANRVASDGLEEKCSEANSRYVLASDPTKLMLLQ